MPGKKRPDDEEEDSDGPPQPPPANDEEDSDSDDDSFGPAPVAPGSAAAAGEDAKPKKKKKRRKLEHEEAFVAALPNADMYERSYMHRDLVTHCAFSPRTDFLVTASEDGHVKFWKKVRKPRTCGISSSC